MPKGFFYDPAEALPTKAKRQPKAPRTLDCAGCGLHAKCKSPRMEPYGRGGLGIAIVAEAPGGDEDEAGIPLVGESGKLLRWAFAQAGVDMDADCTRLNVVQCRPPGNRAPTAEELACCRARWQRQLADIKPDLIFAFGGPAIREMLSDAEGITITATTMNGRVIPCPARAAWVCCSFHPSYYLRERGKFDRRLVECVRAGLAALAERGPYTDLRLDEAAYDLLEDLPGVAALLRRLGASGTPVALDYEATGLDPYAPGFRLLTLNLADTPDRGYCIPLAHRQARWTPAELEQVYGLVREFLQSPAPKVIQNWQYEELVSRVVLGVGVANVVADTMVREHVLDNRRGVCKQEFQEYVRYGSVHKAAVNRAALDHEFLDVVARYGTLDARYCLRWHHDQEAELDDDLRRAYGLFHRVIPHFVSCKQRGIHLDMEAMAALEADVDTELDVVRNADALPALQEYHRKYGKAWESGSNQAKQRLFYDVMGLRPVKPTPGGAKKLAGGDFLETWFAGKLSVDDCSVDAESIQGLLAQLADARPERKLLQAVADEAHLVKIRGYLKGYRDLADTDGILHPSFLLHKVGTYRTSSADPNFQNIPVRNPTLARIRRVFRPRFDYFLEMDFKAAEVRGYAIHTNDAWLVDKVTRGIDFHRRYAGLLYDVPEADVTKGQRDTGKGGFVFATYYGSYPRGIAAGNPQWPQARIERVWRQFWVDQPDVKAWQERTEQFYWDNGYLPYMTGFRPRYADAGFLSHNDCCNYPIQGFACHRLLHVFLQMEEWMRAEGLRGVIVGQIHDSIVFDLPDDEVEQVILKCNEIVRSGVPEWGGADMVVPWEAEFKIGKNLVDFQAV